MAGTRGLVVTQAHRRPRSKSGGSESALMGREEATPRHMNQMGQIAGMGGMGGNMSMGGMGGMNSFNMYMGDYPEGFNRSVSDS